MNTELLTNNLRIRLNESENNAVIRLAQIFGERTRSRIIRKMIREAAGEGPDLLKDDMKLMQEAILQIGALGRNINQLARAANSGDRVTVDPVLLRAATQEIIELRKELVAVIMRSRNRWVHRD